IGYYGSKVTAPCARNIMEESLKYLGYYPEYTETEYKELDVPVPLLLDEDVAKAQETLEALGLKYQVVGDGEKVVGQCPSTGLSISPEGTVILYTVENYMPDKVEVPDLQGFTATDANEALTNRGLNYVAVGASTDRSDVLVLSQSIEAGEMVEVGTVIQLTYFVNDQTG
ncbi:MAG TPA: peptidoglycan glycosyltransferase, partial [Ruminococcus sp.]|nr:peptidoglycan glycosyltransferase [Ruminococcus sp.]